MKYVVAGSYKQYREYLKQNGDSPAGARYLHSCEQVLGLREVDVVKFGEWWKNPILDELYKSPILMGLGAEFWSHNDPNPKTD